MRSRTDLDAAEREVERFKAENGLVGVGGQYIDDKVILALSDQLANARAMKVGIRVKANNLANVNIDDVLSGAFPEELLSSNLIELRKQYTETRSNADSLATSLGPRHPRYIAAKSALDTIRAEISAELRRIVASFADRIAARRRDRAGTCQPDGGGQEPRHGPVGGVRHAARTRAQGRRHPRHL